MATVYLHVGMPKTGTTAIQTFLSDNEAILNKHGISFPDFGLRYPRTGFYRNGHFLVAAGRGSDKKKDKTIPAAEYIPTLDKIAKIATMYDKILLTEEKLWRAGQDRPGFWTRLKKDFSDRNLSIKIIVYLRRQDMFIQSLYAQMVKAGYCSLTFNEYVDSMYEKNYPLDYPAHLDMLSELFGRENLIVRVYENGQYKGPEHNLHSDFLDIFNLTLNDGFIMKQSLRNQTMDGTHLEIRRLLNCLPGNFSNSPLMKKSISTMQCTNPYTQNRGKHSFFSFEEQKAFLAQFEASNSRVAREYLGRKDGILFYDSIDPLPKEDLAAEELLRDTILVFGNAIQLLEEQNNELKNKIKKLSQTQADSSNKFAVLQMAKKVIKKHEKQ